MLNSKLLKQFIAVAEELHFGRAAQRVNIAQSPLSQAIRKLEDEVGTALFDRNKRTVVLTPAGRIFLKEAHQWLKYEQVAIERTRHAGSGEIGHLAIGFVGSIGYGLMPDLISDFRLQYPGVQLRMVESTTLEQIEMLENRYLDVGLLRTPLSTQSAILRTRPYAKDRLMVALPKNHPLGACASIRLEQLASESFIVFSREKVPAANASMISACLEAGFYPRIAQECSQIASVICLIATGLSVALVPSNLISLMHHRVAYVPLQDSSDFLSIEISLAWRGDNRNPALNSILAAASGRV